MLIDASAEYCGYAADITRMIAVNGKLSKRQRDIEQSVKYVHETCLKELRPGLKFMDYALWAQSMVGQELLKNKLIRNIDDNKEIMKYFPHLISHSLGLDTHDAFDYRSAVLQENMVITVEPGIYIPEEGIGVRIEDDILITKNGAENLSSHIEY